MRLCANENVPGDCVAALRQREHDVLWIREVARGSGDDAVLAKAQTEARLLITFDKDFGELVFRRGAAATRGIVLFRLRKPSPALTPSLLARAFSGQLVPQDPTDEPPGKLLERLKKHQSPS